MEEVEKVEVKGRRDDEEEKEQEVVKDNSKDILKDKDDGKKIYINRN